MSVRGCAAASLGSGWAGRCRRPFDEVPDEMFHPSRFDDFHAADRGVVVEALEVTVLINRLAPAAVRSSTLPRALT